MTVILEQQEVLRDFTSRLESLNISYMLTGSMAMAFYAQPRMTADIDIVVEIKSEQADEIIKTFEPDYYIPHGSMRSAIARNTMFNMLHQQTLVKVDCAVRKTSEFQLNAFSHRRKVDFGSFEIWIISHEDLILSKLFWAKETQSEMQIRDITNLLRSPADLDYLKFWSVKLSVQETFDAILQKLAKE